MSLDIAVVGLAAAAGNGASADEVWDACLAGVSGVAPLRGIDLTGVDVRLGGQLADAAFASSALDERDPVAYDRSQLLAVALADAALRDAGEHPYPSTRLGAVISTAGGGVESHDVNNRAVRERGQRGVAARYPVAATMSIAASLPAMRLGLQGPVFTTSGACASFAFAVVSAAHLLMAGDADLVLAGVVELVLTPAVLAGFANMRILAHHDDPARASRPLDRDRTGLVMAEGGAVVCLERRADAVARGAPVRAILLGYGLTSDAGGVLAADPDGVARAVTAALGRAGVPPEEIGHLNLHAAGTAQGDVAESDGLHRALGPVAGRIPATAPKSLLGHAMGAAAGVETVLALRTLETGLVPPTLNLEHIDERIALDAAPSVRRSDAPIALKTTVGLGGLNAALVLSARR